MNIFNKEDEKCFSLRFFLISGFLILICYGNSFHASWHLDDFHNITEQSKLHINNLYPQTIYNAIFERSDKNRAFYRPIPCLSFALNWYLNQDDVTGYHLVNICVHILTAFFLYLAVLGLFKTPNIIKLSNNNKSNAYFIAALTAVLWAANPIQTQAVTYIVQRMASMAAMFYILGIYFYISARNSLVLKKRILFFSGCFVAFLMAVGSKENTLLFPVAILLLEIVFYQDVTDKKTRRTFLLVGTGCLLLTIFSGIFFFMEGDLISRLQNGYENRTFTLPERLMTESRILIFYLSQIFYPIADRLSIVHDIKISTSLFRPWTTLPAILFVFMLVGITFTKIKKYPLFSFAVLFFFLNHLIESTILPLELIFEHRNYLPSLFLFLPIAAGLKKGIDYYTKKNKTMSVLMICFVTFFLVLLGTGTYIRNMAWANEKTLWKDAIQKAPNMARPYQNLAAGYYAERKNYDKVLQLCQKAMNLGGNTKNKEEVLSLVNIAYVHSRHTHDYEKVIQIYKKILALAPEKIDIHYRITLAYLKLGKLGKALEHSHKLISENPDSIKYLSTISFVLVKKNEPQKALPYLIEAIRKDPDDIRVNLSLGVTKMQMQDYESSAHYFKQVINKSPQKIIALFLLIENSIKDDNLKSAEEYVGKLIETVNSNIIQEKLEEFKKPGLLWPVSTDLVAPVIAKKLKEDSEQILKSGRLGDGV